MKTKRNILIALLILLGAGAFFAFRHAGSKQSGTTAAQSPGAPVTVAMVEQKAVPIELRLFGNVEPYATVDVKSQITGVLTNVAVSEGQTVSSGDVLFMIDSRPAAASLKQAEANLQRAQTQRDNAKRELDRQAELRKKGISSENDYDQALTQYATLSATVLAEEAALENARLQLEYCVIKAPLNGRLGELKVEEGNLVKANDLTLVKLNQIQPIKVGFAVPQKELPAIMRETQEKPLVVRVYLPNSPEQVETGQLVFINNQVDLRTGTIDLKAAFDNEHGLLWPGQFINVILTVAVESNAVTIPHHAIASGQDGSHVFVVKTDNTVELRQVTVSRMAGDEAVIAQGLGIGEQVVTDGQLRLTPGALINIKNSEKAISSP